MSTSEHHFTTALTLSDHAIRASEQAIGFLMQQGVENADCISLAAGLVDERTLPVQLARNSLDSLLNDSPAGRRVLQYGTTPGPDELRQTIRQYLAELEGSSNQLAGLPAEQIVLTTGSQQLLLLATQALVNPGDICLVAAPTYFVYLGLLEAAGARIVPVRSDDHGMCPEDLEQTLDRLHQEGVLHRVRLVYTVSYYDNPSGISISADRRPKLLQAVQRWSKTHRILILEDAAYRELQYSGPILPSIWSFDETKEFVILAQTFSKSFSPGVRVGFGVLPADLVKPVCDLKGNADFGSAHLNQNLICHVLRTREYHDHVRLVTAGYKRKRDAMLDAADEYFKDIPGVSWVHPDGGMYVWMSLPTDICTGFLSPLFHRATQVEKVMYVPGELSYPSSWNHRPQNQMRLSFGVQNADGVREGIRRLANAVRHVISVSNAS